MELNRVPDSGTAQTRLRFDLRAIGSVAREVRRPTGHGAVVFRPGEALVAMRTPRKRLVRRVMQRAARS